jgi:hypothetical protein
MEEVASKVVQFSYDNLIDATMSEKACTFVRFLKTNDFETLVNGGNPKYFGRSEGL